jgi:hypothetical protein
MKAVADGNDKLVDELMKQPFDINRTAKVTTNTSSHHATQPTEMSPIDVAWQRENHGLVLKLLNNNARFPRDFSSASGCEKIQMFIETTNDLHAAVKADDKDTIDRILEQHSNLVYFYSVDNVSAATTAIKNDKFDVYVHLLDRGRSIGPLEDIDDIFGKLIRQRKIDIRNGHSKLSKVPEMHINKILPKIVVGHDDRNVAGRHQLIYRSLTIINDVCYAEMDVGRLLLRLIAAHDNVKIHFDFNQTSVQHMTPWIADKHTNGLFFFNGNIYVGAKDLLVAATERNVIGVFSHELNHMANHIVFRNRANPYEDGDDDKRNEFNLVIEACCSTRNVDEIVNVVYKYERDLWPAELIVRVPHMLAHYHDDPTRITVLASQFERLFTYFKDFVVPQMQTVLDVLEKLIDGAVTFDDLPKPLKRAIENNITVDLQGNELQLSDILSSEKVTTAVRQLSQGQLHRVLGGLEKAIKVGSKPAAGGNFHLQRLLMGDSTTPPMSYEDIENREDIFLLSNMAGAGKTATFKHLSVRLKERFHDKWVSFVDLKQHLKIFERYQADDVEKVMGMPVDF